MLFLLQFELLLLTTVVVDVNLFAAITLSCPRVENGLVLTVGTGDVGQLGLGPDVEEKTRPGHVASLAAGVVAVAAGGLHTVCLTNDGQVSCHVTRANEIFYDG